MNFDWKMFIGTFFLIFLAELGDKTQLTALARSATGGKWLVFIAASLALVCSTLIAVLFGSVLRKYIPDFFIKLVAGLLFLVFGGLTLFSAFKDKDIKLDEKPTFNLEINEGKPAGWVVKLAGYFEHTAAQDYRDLAKETSGDLSELFLSLAEEEEGHLAQLKTGIVDIPDAKKDFFKPLLHDVAKNIELSTKSKNKVQDKSDTKLREELIAHAIEHEESTAQFYMELAHSVKIPALKKNFTVLADAEKGHILRLQEWKESKKS